MDIMAKAKEAIDILDQIDAYGHTLMPKLSELDCKEQDILHYIEDNKVNMLYCYNIVKKIKDIRVDKRCRFDPWVRKSPGGYGDPLHYSCLENPMDRGAWRATVHRVTKSWMRLKQLSS